MEDLYTEKKRKNQYQKKKAQKKSKLQKTAIIIYVK